MLQDDQGKIRHKSLKLHPRDIAYIQFILEGYEGLATISTVDPQKARIDFSIMPDFVIEVDEILADLEKYVPFEDISFPSP
ncbi:MAG: DUF4911 domain-containing protein [Deltaproteobacteria bacterium]|nr:DUF4911 domain-containing protein [Deltaproteobacteria bacterium]